jgi:hypothetical protein
VGQLELPTTGTLSRHDIGIRIGVHTDTDTDTDTDIATNANANARIIRGLRRCAARGVHRRLRSDHSRFPLPPWHRIL